MVFAMETTAQYLAIRLASGRQPVAEQRSTPDCSRRGAGYGQAA